MESMDGQWEYDMNGSKNCSMSLVAYGISDESGSEEETETEGTDKLTDTEASEEVEQVQNGNTLDSDVTSSDKEDESEDEATSTPMAKGARTMRLPEPKSGSSVIVDPDEDDVDVSGRGLFSSLPAPKVTSKLSLEMELDDQPVGRSQSLVKKETVKITVPSLSEFKDDDTMEPERKKLKPSSKGSGLFALLPAPKNMTVKEAKRSLVPNVLTKKPVAVAINPAPSVTKQIENSKPSLALTSYEDSGDEMEGGDKGDYFSLNSDTAVESSAAAVPGSDEGSLADGTGSDDDDDGHSVVPEAMPSELESEWPAASPQGPADVETTSVDQDDQDLLLNKEAMERLCGRRAARDRAGMQFIEVSGDALMPDPKEWLTKQLTQEQQKKSHSHRRNEGPTSQQKRKHQITYLAFQAKENELELKNQWSQNRMTRKQTQSKYGF